MGAPTITISPDVLRWARESSGYSVGYIAEKSKLPSSTIKKWEEEPSEISFSNIERLAKIFKRPAIALLLDKPPTEVPNPPYFRKSDGNVGLSSEVMFAIRKARNLQNISKELEENLDKKSTHIFERSLLDRPPEQIAERERKTLGMGIEEQVMCKSPSEALRKIKDRIEAKGIFVFQIGMPIEQMQGLSLIDEKAPVIVLNSKDIPERRIFTMLHEYAHILLSRPGVCAGIDDPTSAYGGLETWCNSFAGSFLVPKKELSEMFQRKSLYGRTNYKRLRSLARYFHVSTQMVYVRLKVDRLMAETDAKNLEDMFRGAPKKFAKTGAKKERKLGGIPQYKKTISEKGTRFVGLVLENEAKKKIATSEALDYLSIKLESLQKIKSATSK